MIDYRGHLCVTIARNHSPTTRPASIALACSAPAAYPWKAVLIGNLNVLVRVIRADWHMLAWSFEEGSQLLMVLTSKPFVSFGAHQLLPS